MNIVGRKNKKRLIGSTPATLHPSYCLLCVSYISICLLINLFTYSFIHLFIYSFIHLFQFQFVPLKNHLRMVITRSPSNYTIFIKVSANLPPPPIILFIVFCLFINWVITFIYSFIYDFRVEYPLIKDHLRGIIK